MQHRNVFRVAMHGVLRHKQRKEAEGALTPKCLGWGCHARRGARQAAQAGHAGAALAAQAPAACESKATEAG